MKKKFKPWKTTPKTPKDGFITDFRLQTGQFDIIYKIYDTFKKETAVGLHRLKIVAKKDGFKYANVYDHLQRVQILSYTKKAGYSWFVKRLKEPLVNPEHRPFW